MFPTGKINRTKASIEKEYSIWMGNKHTKTKPFTNNHPEVMSNFIKGYRHGTNAKCNRIEGIDR